MSVTKPEPTNDYLTVAEVAAILRVNRGTVYEMVSRGDLPSVRVGRKIRIARSALDRIETGS